MRRQLTIWTTATMMMCVSLGSAVAQGEHAQHSSTTRVKGTKPFEVGFLKGMIDHHLAAIEMGKLCPARATHEELKSMCAEIGSAQLAEVDTMRRWLRDWHGVSYQGRPATMPGAKSLKALTGSRFEIAFMEMMVKHHTMAVGMAKTCESKATHEALKDRCRQMRSAQSTEIDQMNGWLCEWYQKCHASSRSTTNSAVAYTCPMHPEVVQDRPGTCPKCGMALEQRRR